MLKFEQCKHPSNVEKKTSRTIDLKSKIMPGVLITEWNFGLKGSLVSSFWKAEQFKAASQSITAHKAQKKPPANLCKLHVQGQDQGCTRFAPEQHSKWSITSFWSFRSKEIRLYFSQRSAQQETLRRLANSWWMHPGRTCAASPPSHFWFTWC